MEGKNMKEIKTAAWVGYFREAFLRGQNDLMKYSRGGGRE